MIPLCEPEIRGNESAYIQDCLATGWVSSVGSYVTKFEQMIAEIAGTRHAIATVNGTAALHIALLCAGVERDDEVLVSTLTFIAPANAVRYIGAIPVFIDAEPEYWQMNPKLAESFLQDSCVWDGDVLRNKQTHRRIRAIVPVDILGTPVEHEAFKALAKRFRLPLIGDISESLGALYKHKPLGIWTDIGCYSFNGNKLITTGGGGMIVTDDADIAKRARYLTTQAKDDALEYIHGEVGYNYRLTNIQAALGVAQLELLDEYVAAKRLNAKLYTAAISSIPGVTVMREADDALSTFWLFTILIDEAKFGMSSRELIRALSERNIQARPLWQPMHLSPSQHGSQIQGGKVAEKLYAEAVSLPSSVGLTDTQRQRTIAAIHELAKVAL